MPVTITADVSDRARDTLARLRAGIADDAEIGATIGFAGEERFKRHLREGGWVDRVNALGGPSTGFWRSVHDSIGHEPGAGASATVYVLHRGYRLRLEGGVVKPKTRKALSIPVHPSAHGLSASEYPGELEYVPYKALSDDQPLAGLYRKDGDDLGDLIYILRKSTTHHEEPAALPSETTFLEAMADALGDLLDASTT